MILMMFGNILGMNVIGSIMGAKLTTTALTIVKVNALADVQGTLCVEDSYDVLNASFLDQQPDKPGMVVYMTTADCVAALLAGNVAAVITDQTALSWYARNAGAANTFVSPVLQANPFAMVFANHSAPLRAYVDPAVTAATLTAPEWLPFTQALIIKYFGKQATYSDMGDNLIHYPSLIAGAVLLFFPILIALANGDLAGPGLFSDAKSGWRFQLRKAISRPNAAEEEEFMSDKDGALQGHDLSFYRYAVNALEDMQQELTMLKGWHAASVKAGVPTALLNGAPAGGAEAPQPQPAAAASPEVMQMLQALMAEVRDIKCTQSVLQAQQPPQPQAQPQAQQALQQAYLHDARSALRVRVPPPAWPPMGPDARPTS
jgi:hypothetical protein